MSNIIVELEQLSLKTYGYLVDVCEAWVVEELLKNAVHKKLIGQVHAKAFKMRINRKMKNAGCFPIK